MKELEESVCSVVRQENEREYKGKGVQDSGKTGTGVRGRDIEEGTSKNVLVAEMRMLRWMFRVTKLDKIRNERIWWPTKVGEIANEVQERR